MNWKIGDKVRLTGADWPTSEIYSARRGTEHVITGIDQQGRVKFDTHGCDWSLHEGWEIELVERKDSVMSVDFSDVNVGDKVRLTRENGDEATFTVGSKASRGDYLESESNAYWGKNWDTLEIVERAFKPVPGLYSNPFSGDRAVLLENGEAYYTTRGGAWITSDHEDENRQTYQAVREQNGWKREITF